MDAVISWVKQIFILSILSNIITHLCPSPKYAKYASYICGLMIVMVCILPLTSLLNGKISFDEIYSSITSYESMNRLKQELSYENKDSAAAVISEYEKELARTIDEKILDSGYYPSKTAVIIDSDEESEGYGTIKQITLTVSSKKETGNIHIEDISIGESRSAESEDYSVLKNEIAEMLHTTISRIKINGK